MSAEILRRAAQGIRDEWAEGETHIKPVAFYRSVADLLDSQADLDDCAKSLGARGLGDDDPALAVARVYLGDPS